MNVTAEDFTRHYGSLSDEALLEIDPDELTPVARGCLGDEIARRGLDIGEGADGAAEAGAEAASEEAEELICIAEYDFPDEADLARGLLEGAEIPTRVESEPGVVKLLVPEKFAEQALQLLVTPLSDEDLEAQDEAASNPDFEEE